ncbi:MAG: hypothetical protein KDA68_04085 [Planctomycetaceae bacterium]|nr:hypothetical protein [Planctomycetaceae bacterium]
MKAIQKWLLVLLFVLCVVGAFGVGYRLGDVRHYREEIVSNSRLRVVALGLESYYSEYGCFPPPQYRIGPDAPPHSWRLMLSSISEPEYRKIFSEYRFTEAWDSPHNRRVMERLRPWADGFNIDDAGEHDSGGGAISHVLRIFPGDEWPSRNDLRSLEVRVGDDHLLLVIDPKSTVQWNEPRY